MKSNSKIQKRTVEFKAHSRNLFFHILTACNLRCRHCYINPEQHGTNTLDIDTIKKWLRLFSLADHSSSIKRVSDTNVIFLGGEPTLHPDLAEAIREARQLGYASITVDTNGYLFNHILERISPSEVDYLSFSLDGSTKEINDPIRGEGSYETCTLGMKNAAQKGFAISSIFTASRANIQDLPNMPRLLKNLGVSRFFIQVIGIRGNPAHQKDSDLQLSFEEWQSIVPETAMKAAELGMYCTFPKVFLEENEPFACAGLVAENYFVFPNGRVYTCPLCEDYPIHALEIKENKLLKRPPLTESQLFQLKIPEGCVMNRLFHPGNIEYDHKGRIVRKIACCMLKEELVSTT
ncbi:MAG: radical SAM protein [Thermodesulfatator sp.]|nr:MAG: radical SAM protein [Thermodesulfatator sp.]